MSTDPGWYHAEGDPLGTTRYWNGTDWVGGPVDPSDGGGQSAQSGLGSPGTRLGARLIDLVILLIISVIFLFPLIRDLINAVDALPTGASDNQIQITIENTVADRSGLLLLVATAGFLWEWLFTAFAGGTPGKLILGLRITDQVSGERVSLGRAAVRTLNRAAGIVGTLGAGTGNILTLVLGLVGLISLIMLFTDDRHRTVMDRLAGTLVTKAT